MKLSQQMSCQFCDSIQKALFVIQTSLVGPNRAEVHYKLQIRMGMKPALIDQLWNRQQVT